MFCQRCAALLAAFADHPHVSAGSEDQVRARGGGDLRKPQTRLDSREDKRVVAPSEPGALIRSGEQGIDLWTREKADQGAGESLARDSEDALDLCRMSRQLECRVAKERMDSGQTQITAADTEPSLLLEVIEKGGHQGCI